MPHCHSSPSFKDSTSKDRRMKNGWVLLARFREEVMRGGGGLSRFWLPETGRWRVAHSIDLCFTSNMPSTYNTVQQTGPYESLGDVRWRRRGGDCPRFSFDLQFLEQPFKSGIFVWPNLYFWHENAQGTRPAITHLIVSDKPVIRSPLTSEQSLQAHSTMQPVSVMRL